MDAIQQRSPSLEEEYKRFESEIAELLEETPQKEPQKSTFTTLEPSKNAKREIKEPLEGTPQKKRREGTFTTLEPSENAKPEIKEPLEGTPQKKRREGTFTTPESLKRGKEVICSSDPKEKLTPSRSSELGDALRVLINLDNTPTRERYSNIFRQGLVGFDVQLHSPRAVETLHDLVEGRGSSWVTRVVVMTNAADNCDYTGIRLSHVEKLKKKSGGFHFCPLGHPERSSIEVIGTNSQTGVWVGRYRGKVSSFFPASIATREELTRLLIKKKFVASYTANGKIKQLSLIKNGENSFYVIDYRRVAASIYTVFPLFYAKYLSEIEEDIIMPSGSSIKKHDLMTYLLGKEKLVLHKKIEISISDTVHLLRLDGELGIPVGLGVYIFVTSEEMNYTPKWP